MTDDHGRVSEPGRLPVCQRCEDGYRNKSGYIAKNVREKISRPLANKLCCFWYVLGRHIFGNIQPVPNVLLLLA
jgi:hypothetical protein